MACWLVTPGIFQSDPRDRRDRLSKSYNFFEKALLKEPICLLWGVRNSTWLILGPIKLEVSIRSLESYVPVLVST